MGEHSLVATDLLTALPEAMRRTRQTAVGQIVYIGTDDPWRLGRRSPQPRFGPAAALEVALPSPSTRKGGSVSTVTELPAANVPNRSPLPAN